VKNRIVNLKNKFKHNLFYQNIAIVTGGNILAKIIGILATPIITRIYSPHDYGMFSIILSFIGIVGSLSTLRYAVTIPIEKDDNKAFDILRLCFIITISLCVLWILGVYFLGNNILNYYNLNHLSSYIWFIPFIFLGKGIYEALSNWVIRDNKFKLVTRTKLSQNLLSSGLKIGLGALNYRPIGLFWGQVALEFAGISSFLSRLMKVNPTFFKNFSKADIKNIAIRYKKFPLIQSWSQLILSSASQLPVLLIGGLYGTAVIGVFGLAQTMINLPMDLIGQSVSQVYYIEIAKIGKDSPLKIYQLSVSLTKKLFWISIIPLIVIYAFGPMIFKFVFGNEWIDAGYYVRLISILMLARFVTSPIMNCLNVFEKQKLQFSINILRILIIAIVFLTAYHFNLTPSNTILLYSISLSIFFFLVLFKILQFLKNSQNENL
jgi:O-antigen/teichoic acid export membrane protein